MKDIYKSVELAKKVKEEHRNFVDTARPLKPILLQLRKESDKKLAEILAEQKRYILAIEYNYHKFMHQFKTQNGSHIDLHIKKAITRIEEYLKNDSLDEIKSLDSKNEEFRNRSTIFRASVKPFKKALQDFYESLKD